MTLYQDVVGQDRALSLLRASAASPVHAYLFVGPPGSGKRLAARSFAASLLCADGGCGTCRDCTLALAETHPDVLVVERTGPFITVEQAREITTAASLAPVEGRRKVLVLVDFHLVRDAGPALLKTIEEPSESSVFVVLADDVPPELVTIASRCTRVEFRPVPTEQIVGALVAGGTAPTLAAEVAAAAQGRLDRARLLAIDPGFQARRDAWANVPRRLDGSGAAVVVVAAELIDMVDGVAAPLAEVHSAELAALDADAERYGDKRQAGARRKRVEERQKREVRRLRQDELRFGLATLEAAYRDALAAGSPVPACVRAVEVIAAAARELVRNPSEALMLQALLLQLSACETGLAVAV